MSTLIVKNLDAPTGESIVAPDLQYNLASSDLPTGSVLQVKHVTKTDTWSSSSTSFSDVTGLSITMTPRDANSKFYITSSLFVGAYWWGSNGGYYGVNVNGSLAMGSGSSIWTLQYGADSGNTPYEGLQWEARGLVSASNTSAHTFQTVAATGVSTYALHVNRSYNGYVNDGESYLTVMEIAG